MNEESPIKRGERARASYIADLDKKGIRLVQVQDQSRRRVIYKTHSGKIVGLPYARELPQKGPGRWFLGLPQQHFDFVVLLCETSQGELLDFVFPPDFVGEIWDSLSSAERGQGDVKFEAIRQPQDDKLAMKNGRLNSLLKNLDLSKGL
jgi:hypothetical protein